MYPKYKKLVDYMILVEKVTLMLESAPGHGDPTAMRRWLQMFFQDLACTLEDSTLKCPLAKSDGQICSQAMASELCAKDGMRCRRCKNPCSRGDKIQVCRFCNGGVVCNTCTAKLLPGKYQSPRFPFEAPQVATAGRKSKKKRQVEAEKEANAKAQERKAQAAADELVEDEPVDAKFQWAAEQVDSVLRESQPPQTQLASAMAAGLVDAWPLCSRYRQGRLHGMGRLPEELVKARQEHIVKIDQAVVSVKKADANRAWPQIKAKLLNCPDFWQTDLVKTLEKLLSNGMDINMMFPGKRALIHFACGYNNPALLEFLLLNGANAHQRTHDEDQALPIEIAAHCGSSQCLDLLLNFGSLFGRSLHLAANAGGVRAVEALIDATAAVDSRCCNFAPTELAVISGHTPALEKLLARGARADGRVDRTACAVFLSTGLNITEPSLLHLVTMLGGAREDMAAKIMTHRQSPLQSDELKRITQHAKAAMCRIVEPSYHSAWDVLRRHMKDGRKHVQINTLMQELKDSISKDGSDAIVDARNLSGWTPLMMASFIDNEELTKMLLVQKAAPSAKNANGQTALLWARWVQSSHAEEQLTKMATLAEEDSAGLERLKDHQEACKDDEDDRWVFNLDLAAMRNLGSQKKSYSAASLQVSNRMMDNLLNFALEQLDHFDFMMPDKGTESIQEWIEVLKQDRKMARRTDGEASHDWEFGDLDDFVFNAKVFVLDRLASGRLLLRPSRTCALFMYHADRYIAQVVHDTIIGKTKDRKHQYFSSIVVDALRQISKEPPGRVVYVGARMNQKQLDDLLNNKDDITWPGLPMATFDPVQAHNHALQGKEANEVSVIYKVRTNSARDVSNFCYYPEQQRVMLLRDAPSGELARKFQPIRLRVAGFSHHSNFQCCNGAKPASGEDKMKGLRINTDWIIQQKIDAREARAKRHDITKLLVFLDEVVKE